MTDTMAAEEELLFAFHRSHARPASRRCVYIETGWFSSQALQPEQQHAACAIVLRCTTLFGAAILAVWWAYFSAMLRKMDVPGVRSS